LRHFGNKRAEPRHIPQKFISSGRRKTMQKTCGIFSLSHCWADALVLRQIANVYSKNRQIPGEKYQIIAQVRRSEVYGPVQTPARRAAGRIRISLLHQRRCGDMLPGNVRNDAICGNAALFAPLPFAMRIPVN